MTGPRIEGITEEMPSASSSPAPPRVILSAFADEAANRKTALEQLTALAAIGLSHYSPRFVDVEGAGAVRHVVDLEPSQRAQLKTLHREFGISVTSIGSRLGKVKLRDEPDRSHNKFIPFADYLKGEVAATLRAAVELETKLVRGFSFYPPLGADPEPYLGQAVEQVGAIVEACAREGLVYGLEIEPNLVGSTGELMAALATKIKHRHLVLIYDGGNIACQNKDRRQCFREYEAMRPHLGWMHVKDYRIDPDLEWTGIVDEERLRNFVPADCGDSGYDDVLSDLKIYLPALERRMHDLGAPGFFLETEPHLKGGGQFGGFSGPDGMGVAVRSLCKVLDNVGIDYDLRSFEDIRRVRGF
jgi:sugar phosphate isomerase/epimerase